MVGLRLKLLYGADSVPKGVSLPARLPPDTSSTPAYPIISVRQFGVLLVGRVWGAVKLITVIFHSFFAPRSGFFMFFICFVGIVFCDGPMCPPD